MAAVSGWPSFRCWLFNDYDLAGLFRAVGGLNKVDVDAGGDPVTRVIFDVPGEVGAEGFDVLAGDGEDLDRATIGHVIEDDAVVRVHPHPPGVGAHADSGKNRCGRHHVDIVGHDDLRGDEITDSKEYAADHGVRVVIDHVDLHMTLQGPNQVLTIGEIADRARIE